ncbi:MAG TPA: tetratricopeptide repeat protein, partial [Myxococcota bacterium]|nr:tetratricopeptide repeat protein [Myxococcota bacterium]
MMSKQFSPLTHFAQVASEHLGFSSRPSPLDEQVAVATHEPDPVAIRPASISLDLAVQFFSWFGGQKLNADEFATVVVSLASGLKDKGRLSEAESLYRQVIAHQRQNNDPNVLTSMNNVAMVLQAQGKLAEAEALLRQTLESLKARQGAEDANSLRTQNSLACLLQNQGKYSEA